MDRLGVEKLNNQNYGSWKFTVELLLVKDDLWRFVNPGEPPQAVAATEANPGNAAEVAAWKAGDQKARATIGLLVEQKQHVLIRNTTSAKEAWDNLQRHHERITLSAKVGIFYQLCEMRYVDGEDIEQYFYDMERLFEKLSKAGTNLGRELEVMVVLRSLPKSFSTLTTALDCRKEDEVTLELVKQKVIDEVLKRRREGSSDQALKVEDRMQKKKNSVIVCHNCKKVGHKKKDCNVKVGDVRVREGSRQRRSAQAKVTTPDTGDFAFAVTNSVREWIVDSGASWHICANRKFFVEMGQRKAGTPSEVVVADGRKCPVEGEGTCKLRCCIENGVVKEVTLSQVLYIPELEANLLSVGCLIKKGADVSFNKAGCVVSSSGKVAAVAVLKNGLYELTLERSPVAAAAKSHNPLCIHEWHRKLGHRDPEAIFEVEKQGLATGIEIHPCGIKATCECCVEGKMTRRPFPKKAKQKSKAILDLVHSDLCGPMNTKTPGGCRYFLTFIDDYSRYSWIYFLREKSETVDCFDHFVRMTKTQYGKVPKVLRSDQGGEYRSKALGNLCKDFGILQQFTTAYTPEQNGVAERRNRYLVEMARCMLLDAKLGYQYWAEAVSTANFLQNVLPTRAKTITPYETVHGNKPDLAEMHVFGENAYVHVPKEQRTKLAAKAKKMTFVGYSLQHKGYRMIDLKTNKVVISRDVRFLKQEEQKMFVQQEETSENVVEYEFREAEVQEMPVQQQVEVPDNDENQEQEDFDENGNDTVFEDADDFQEDQESEESSDTEDLVQEEAATVEVRRSKRSTKGIPPARYRADMLTECPVKKSSQEPQTYHEAVSGSEREQWKAAIAEELASLKENDTWVEVDLPSGTKPVGCRWIFKKKRDATGKVIRYKARLVAQGYTQVYGQDFDEIFAPVAKQVTLRVLLTIAARKDMIVKHIDVKTAYLYGTLDEQIFMRLPPGVEASGEKKACLLKRSLYGLKQSARMWNQRIDGTLKKMGFKPSDADPCLYVRHREGKTAFILLYVDDMLVACSSQTEYDGIVKSLGGEFNLTQLGDVHSYLGIDIEKRGKQYYLNQAAYIRTLAERFGMHEAKPQRIPMDPGYIQLKEEKERLPNCDKFQSLVGGLLYLAVTTRPDIAVSASILGRRVSKPTAADWTEAKRVLRYLIGTSCLKLRLGGGDETLEGFSDVDWAGDATDRKSTSGYLFRLDGGLVHWGAKKQTCVALSSTEAEYISLSVCCQELEWLLRLLESFGEQIALPVKIMEDNQSCITLLKNDDYTKRSKHVDTRYHFVRDLAKKGRINVQYYPTADMLADMLTKPLNRVKLEDLRSRTGLATC